MRTGTLSRDAGFTLIELMLTLAVGGILMGMAGAGLTTWSSNSEHKGARDEIVSVLRVTAERALSEGRTYCLAFGTTGSWQTYRSSCGVAGTRPADAGHRALPRSASTGRLRRKYGDCSVARSIEIREDAAEPHA